MARYIDADALLENLKKQYGEELGWQCTVNMSDVGMMIEDAPTADVAPKSEVERLNKELDELAEEHSDLIVEKDHLFDEVVSLRKALSEYEETSGLKQAKAEVAREIFEEIESLFGNKYVPYPLAVLAELKKKYTGE